MSHLEIWRTDAECFSACMTIPLLLVVLTSSLSSTQWIKEHDYLLTCGLVIFKLFGWICLNHFDSQTSKEHIFSCGFPLIKGHPFWDCFHAVVSHPIWRLIAAHCLPSPVVFANTIYLKLYEYRLLVCVIHSWYVMQIGWSCTPTTYVIRFPSTGWNSDHGLLNWTGWYYNSVRHRSNINEASLRESISIFDVYIYICI